MVKHCHPLLTCLLLGFTSACNLPPTQLEPSPQPSASAIPLPEPTPSQLPSASPTPLPSPQPSATITAPPTPDPSPQPGDPDIQNTSVYTGLGDVTQLGLNPHFSGDNGFLIWSDQLLMRTAPEYIGISFNRYQAQKLLSSDGFTPARRFFPIFNASGKGIFAWEPDHLMSHSEPGPTSLRAMQNFESQDDLGRALGDSPIGGQISETGQGSLFVTQLKNRHDPETRHTIYKYHAITDYLLDEPPVTFHTQPGRPETLHIAMDANKQIYLLAYQAEGNSAYSTYWLGFEPDLSQHVFQESTQPTLKRQQQQHFLKFPVPDQENTWHVYWLQDTFFDTQQPATVVSLPAPPGTSIIDFAIQPSGQGIYLLKHGESLIAREIQQFQATGNYYLVQAAQPETVIQHAGLTVNHEGQGLVYWMRSEQSPAPLRSSPFQIWTRPVTGFQTW